MPFVQHPSRIQCIYTGLTLDVLIANCIISEKLSHTRLLLTTINYANYAAFSIVVWNHSHNTAHEYSNWMISLYSARKKAIQALHVQTFNVRRYCLKFMQQVSQGLNFLSISSAQKIINNWRNVCFWTALHCIIFYLYACASSGWSRLTCTFLCKDVNESCVYYLRVMMPWPTLRHSYSVANCGSVTKHYSQ